MKVYCLFCVCYWKSSAKIIKKCFHHFFFLLIFKFSIFSIFNFLSKKQLKYWTKIALANNPNWFDLVSQCRLLCSKTADGSSMKHFPENLVTSGKGYFEFYNLNNARPPVRWEICKEKNWRYYKELLCGDTVNLGLGLPVSDQKLAVTHCKTFWKKTFMLLK